MSKFTDYANDYVNSISAGKTPRKKFMDFCGDAVDVEGIKMTEEQAARLFYSATGKEAYKSTNGINKKMAKRLLEMIDTIDNNLAKSPKTMAELCGCRATRRAAWSENECLKLPDGSLWADETTLRGYLRDVLAESWKHGKINREEVSSCGIVVCYRYSL